MARAGHTEKVMFEKRLESGERRSHVPIWWKGFPSKGLEGQLPEQGKGNRRLGLRSERLSWAGPYRQMRGHWLLHLEGKPMGEFRAQYVQKGLL